jgi:hypothetical protein
VRVAVLLFSAVTSFFLGTITLTLGGARALTLAFQPFSGLVGLQGDEPWHSVIVVLSLGAPGFFFVMAVLSVILGRRGRPLD